VIILDVRLPGGTGFDLCGELRRGGNAAPVLMLTALDGVDDRVRGLEVGRTTISRSRSPSESWSPASRRWRAAGLPCLRRDIGLPTSKSIWGPPGAAPRPADHPQREGVRPVGAVRAASGRVLDRSTITAHVWDDNHDPFANLLEVLVGRLRRKIDDGFDPKLITTLRGAGYRFGP